MKNENSKFLEGMLSELDCVFDAENFRRKKTTYSKKTDNYLYLVNWQISNDDLQGKIKFTINIGVHDLNLAEILEEETPRDVWECHLNERIGFLLPDQNDKWWIVDLIFPVPTDLVDEMRIIVKESLLPYFSNFSERDDLRELWQSGVAPGQTDRQRLYFLSLLQQAR